MEKCRIRKISGHKTALVIAGIFSILSAIWFLIFGIPMGLFSIFTGAMLETSILLIFLIGVFSFMILVIFNFVATYIWVRLFCLLYNKLSGHFGGIEFFVDMNSDFKEDSADDRDIKVNNIEEKEEDI